VHESRELVDPTVALCVLYKIVNSKVFTIVKMIESILPASVVHGTHGGLAVLIELPLNP
jgi:hypothetical protein